VENIFRTVPGPGEFSELAPPLNMRRFLRHSVHYITFCLYSSYRLRQGRSYRT